MTAIVGILCDKGIVVGADSSATFSAGQLRTIEQPTEKITIIGNNVIIAGAGSVGLGQRFNDVVEKAWTSGLFKSKGTNELHVAKSLSRNGLEDFKSTYAPANNYAALVAFPFGGKAHLCEFDLQWFQPELKTKQLWYCSIGATQTITDSLLAMMRGLFWLNGPPSVNEGIFAAAWVLDHAVEVNPGGVNRPIRLAVLSVEPNGNTKAEMLSDQVLGEHRQNIEGAKNALRDYCKNLQNANPHVPEVPQVVKEEKQSNPSN